MEQRPEQQEPQAGQAGGLRWDTSGMRSHSSDVANAIAGADEVVLSFGAKRGADLPGGDIGVELLQRIGLRPLTAKHLHDMLGNLFAEEDAKANRPK